jgi:alkylhydroperoxidase family enzyme
MAHTASGALHFGISAEKLAAIADFASSPLFSPAEKSALAVAEAAGMAPNGVTDAMFTGLRKHWTENKVVEIVAAIAATGFVNRWNATMATPLEDEPMEVGEKHLARHGWSPGPHRR